MDHAHCLIVRASTHVWSQLPPGSGRTADEAIKQLNSDYQIYKSVEQQLLHKKTRLLSKVPDLHRALDMVNMLKEKAGDEVRAVHLGNFARAQVESGRWITICCHRDAQCMLPIYGTCYSLFLVC